jgi:hypothetical protein
MTRKNFLMRLPLFLKCSRSFQDLPHFDTVKLENYLTEDSVASSYFAALGLDQHLGVRPTKIT